MSLGKDSDTLARSACHLPPLHCCHSQAVSCFVGTDGPLLTAPAFGLPSSAAPGKYKFPPVVPGIVPELMLTVSDWPHFRAHGGPAPVTSRRRGLSDWPGLGHMLLPGARQWVGSAPPRAHRPVLRSRGVEAGQAGAAGVRCLGPRCRPPPLPPSLGICGLCQTSALVIPHLVPVQRDCQQQQLDVRSGLPAAEGHSEWPRCQSAPSAHLLVIPEQPCPGLPASKATRFFAWWP